MKKILTYNYPYHKLPLNISLVFLLLSILFITLGCLSIKSTSVDATPVTKTWISDRLAIVDIPNNQFPGVQITNAGAWYNTCGISNGKGYCWGSNTVGELGDGTTTNRSKPTGIVTSGVLSGKTVTAVSSGLYNSCAIANGAAYCWGDNAAGALGSGNFTSSNTPVAVSTAGVLSGKVVTQISSAYQHVCAVANGAAYCWGWNDSGELGNGSGGYGTYSNVPVAVSTAGVLSGKSVIEVAGGSHFSCALASGAVYCWGTGGKLGDGTSNSSNVPVAVSTAGVLSGKKVLDITGGNLHACALTDGAIYCWGANNLGQLGNGTTTASTVPVSPTTSGVLSGKVITNISAGAGYTCVVASGKAYCWGYNVSGQLGDGTTTQRNTPVAVSTSGALNGKTVTSISAGASTTCATADGQTYCWGQNSSGQLGNGGTTDSLVPVAVSAP